MALNPLFEQDDDDDLEIQNDGDPVATPPAEPAKPPVERIEPIQTNDQTREIADNVAKTMVSANQASRSMREALKADYPELLPEDVETIIEDHLRMGVDYTIEAVNSGMFKQYAKTIAYDRKVASEQARAKNAGGRPDSTPVGPLSPRLAGGSTGEDMVSNLEKHYGSFGKPTRAQIERLHKEAPGSR